MQGDTQLGPPEEKERVLRREADREEKEARPEDEKARDFLTHCLSRWKIMADAEDFQRKRSIEEVEFNAGKHWSNTMRKEREDKDRVVQEVNRTPQYLNQVANAQRMTRPNIIIKPNGNGADEDGARVKQGIIRSIERRSDAESIRDDCFYNVLEKGWTYYRTVIEWEHEKSNKRVVRTKRIFDDFSVYCDPASTEPDKTDAVDWFITHDMPTDSFETEFEDEIQHASLTEFVGLGDRQKEWIGEKTVRIAEYFYKDKKKEKLYMLADDPYADGKWEDELTKNEEGKFVGVAYVEGEPGFRWSYRTRIMWALISATNILDGNADKTAGREYVKDGKYVPIIPVNGRRLFLNGHVIYVGMVRDAIEPCLAADYWLTIITEMVALGPRAPWIVAYESIAQYREMWDTSNIENYAALFYDKFDAEGNEQPAPFRNFGEPPIQAMTFILNYAEEDLKRVMGIYERSLGATGPEHSGVAINAVQREADIANFNYVDNLKRSISLEAKIDLDYIPKVMTAPQVLEILRTDNQKEKVWINKAYKDHSGKEKYHDLTVGDYDVEVEVGPSMATRREAAAQGINEYIKVDPAAAPFVGDLLARNLDFPDKAELEKRLKIRAVAAGVPDDNPESGAADVPDQFKRQYQAQAKQVEQLTQMLQTLQQKFETEEAKYQHERELKAMELASAERQTALKAEQALAIKELDEKSSATTTMMQASIDRLQQDVQNVHDERTSWLDRIFKSFGSGGQGSGNNPDKPAQSM